MSGEFGFFPELASDWKQVPLKGVCDYRVSNVDKVPSDDELPVRLCNYVDVYHNEFITPELELMNATATEAEVNRFGLAVDDVIITKDSESWNDIGVPAVVSESAADMVCGYHLAMLRPMPGVLDGRYLFRCLQARPMQYQFERTVSGVTRYGLGLGAIGRLILPLPPIVTQKAIANYLDRETAKIDAMIAAKERLLKLLAEKRRALITHAVTRGLNPDAPMRDSGVAWLGEIPEHWGIERAKWLFPERDERSELGDEELLTVSHITGVTPRSQKDVTMFKADSMVGYKVCYPGDLVVNTLWAWMGAMGIANQRGIVSPAYHVYKIDKRLTPEYVEAVCRTKLFADETRRFSKGVWSSRLRLYPEGLHEIMYPLPPIAEQGRIASDLEKWRSATKRMRKSLESSLVLLTERRSAVISAAVTGQIDVEAAA